MPLTSSPSRFPDYWVMLGRNMLPGHRLVSVIGRNPDVDTGTVPEDVWTGSPTVYPFPVSASALEVVSTSTNDSELGTGLRRVRIVGLNSSYEEITEDVTMSGTTPSTTTGSFLRVNDVRGLTVGSGEENAGNVIVRVISSGSMLSHMVAGAGRSQQTIYTVPVGHTAWVTFFSMGLQQQVVPAGTEFLDMELRSRTPGSTWVTRNTTSLTTGMTWVEIKTAIPVPFIERTDFKARVSNCSTSNLAVTANIQLALIRNDAVEPG